jgi:SAM-dependent methyltransferase
MGSPPRAASAALAAPRPVPARVRGSLGALVPAFVRQLLYERVVLAWRGIRFRSSDTRQVHDAYSAMTPLEFDGINARQRWANWRTIPRNLARHLDGQPLEALDLCCGSGDSTEVLAFLLPAGSRVLGLDLSPTLIRAARERSYPRADAGAVDVRFRVQSVLEPFREPDGSLVPGASLDLVHSAGAVGSHFDPRATRAVLTEVRRVLRPGGCALIDAGPGGTRPEELVALARDLGFEVCGRSRSCPLDRYWQYCLWSAAPRGSEDSPA